MTGKAPPLSPPSAALYDELLVVLVQGGDRRAADRLFRRWNPRFVRSARRYTGDPGSAEQLAQDCWLAIWRGLSGLADPARFAAWAFGILRRKGADRIADAIRERETVAGDREAEPVMPARQGDALAIRQAMDALPADQRLAAHLFFVEGMALRDIAVVQDIPLGTAKSRIFHARRQLKQALADTNEGEARWQRSTTA